TAFDGKDALEKLKTINPLPDIILLDIMMPIMNGLDTLKEIKQNPEFDAFKNIPVITLTNLVSKEDIEKSLALGAIINLIKSEHEPKEIVKKVKEVIDNQKNKEI
ncbi:response regulator, partial [Candidatus Wolfebacteria bacterium]|nr:response regulator [Candidatus Wolfebacteria bacterium]